MSEYFGFRAAFEPPIVFADFDRKELKKGLGKVGKDVQTIARQLVSKRAISKAFENPGMDTGALRASVTQKVSRSGFSTVVATRDNAAFQKKSDGDFFYPYAVYYGHVAPKKMLKHGQKRVHRKNLGQKVARPRNNFIVEAAERYGRTKYEAAIAQILDKAMKPGVIEGLIK